MLNLRALCLAACLGSTSLPAFAEPLPFEARLTPWGSQGEVTLPTGASVADRQLAALTDERDRLLWVRDHGGFPIINAAERHELGSVAPVLETLRLRLVLSNDLPETYASSPGSLEARTFDFELMQALQRFQIRHGIPAEGALDELTLTALNKTVESRLQDIDQSMQCWQTLAPELGDRFLLVNTTDGTSRVFENHIEQSVVRVNLHATPTDHYARAENVANDPLPSDAAAGGLVATTLDNTGADTLPRDSGNGAVDEDVSAWLQAVDFAQSSPAEVHVVNLANWAEHGIVHYTSTTANTATEPALRTTPADLLVAADPVSPVVAAQGGD